MTPHKIIITGTGRAGTSFLVVLLTRLGYDTGYKPFIEDFNEKIRAGCEYKLFSHNLKQQRLLLKHKPYILKHPKFSIYLERLLKHNLIQIDHLIIPVRNLHQASQSRLKNNLPWKVRGIKTQEQVLAWALGKITATAITHQLPTTFIHYPRLIEDAQYCFNKLDPIFHFNHTKFFSVHQQLTHAPKIKQPISLWRKILYHVT